MNIFDAMSINAKCLSTLKTFIYKFNNFHLWIEYCANGVIALWFY